MTSEEAKKPHARFLLDVVGSNVFESRTEGEIMRSVTKLTSVFDEPTWRKVNRSIKQFDSTCLRSTLTNGFPQRRRLSNLARLERAWGCRHFLLKVQVDFQISPALE